jgi:membrane protease YdiL (CAAX protease family)
MKHFALTAAAFEASLMLLAIALGWLLTTPPLRTFHFDLHDAVLGLVATLPMLALFWLCLKCPWRPFKEIAQILGDTIVPLFRDCRLVELAIIASLAGVGEEMLFRGVIQTAVMQRIGGPSGMWLGLLAAASLFGLLHLITPTYAILAGAIGLYLGWLWLACGNLLVPVTAHGAYDFVALVYLVRAKGLGARG